MHTCGVWGTMCSGAGAVCLVSICYSKAASNVSSNLIK